MGAEMGMPIMAKIIALICCAIAFALTVLYDSVLNWLRSGARHLAKLVAIGGGKRIAKATQLKKEPPTGKPPRPRTV